MDWTAVDNEACAVTRAMDVLGDRWSVLVLREIFNGVRRFDDIQGHIGVSRSVLAMRLKDLVDVGVLTKREYRPDSGRVRHEYRLTEMGRSLQPVMQALMEFGDTWLTTHDEPTMVVRHRGCDAQVHVRSVCDHGHVVEEPRDLYGEIGGAPLRAEKATA
ncbi:winged helix-turn-helix transcriptional regulator [Euzebya rosea]|uniref:winged helix-turn-helix transcriptional regulator n=1 Tax=Euzebya rosea TaxID=2052804 RepID=UPI000D3E7DBA|nr:helix-turn-helix domain-containing protein [Euzebya rosea]